MSAQGVARGGGGGGIRTGPAGAALIKSVSLFVASGRKASAAAAVAASAWKSRAQHQQQQQQQQQQQGAASSSGTQEGQTKKARRRRKRMAEDGKNGAGKCSPKMMETLKKNTHFTKQEIESLVKVYRKLLASSPHSAVGTAAVSAAGSIPGITPAATTCEGLDRLLFRELLHNTFDLVTEDVLMDRIFCAFDRNSCGALRLEDWVMGLSVFLRGTLQERTAFCFLVYDLNNDGFITRDEMFNLLRNCLMKQPGDEDPDEGVKDLVELVLKKLDVDRDGKISYSDYQTAIREEPLLLEAFGQCLPTDSACETFLVTLNS